MQDKLKEIEDRYSELSEMMAQPDVASDFSQMQKLAKEHSDLEGVIILIKQYRQVQKNLQDSETLLAEETDHDLIQMAKDDLENQNQEASNLIESIKFNLLFTKRSRRRLKCYCRNKSWSRRRRS